MGNYSLDEFSLVVQSILYSVILTLPAVLIVKNSLKRLRDIEMGIGVDSSLRKYLQIITWSLKVNRIGLLGGTILLMCLAFFIGGKGNYGFETASTVGIYVIVLNISVYWILEKFQLNEIKNIQNQLKTLGGEAIKNPDQG